MLFRSSTGSLHRILGLQFIKKSTICPELIDLSVTVLLIRKPLSHNHNLSQLYMEFIESKFHNHKCAITTQLMSYLTSSPAREFFLTSLVIFAKLMSKSHEFFNS